MTADATPLRMRTGTSLGRTLYLLGPDDDLEADPKAGTCIGIVDTPELAEAICAAVNGSSAIWPGEPHRHHLGHPAATVGP